MINKVIAQMEDFIEHNQGAGVNALRVWVQNLKEELADD